MKISVVIPAYNRAHCIASALDSVLAQSQSVHEILVVDDGSTDNIDLVLGRYSRHVRLVRHFENKGAAAARNSGIKNSEGDYIAFLDSDDVWLPDKIARQMRYMERHSLEASCTGFFVANSRADPGSVAQRPYRDRIGLEDFVWGCYVSPGTTLMCKRELIIEIGGYDERFRRYEDWDFLIRLSIKDDIEIGYLPDALAKINIGLNYASMRAMHDLDKIFSKNCEHFMENKAHYKRFRSAICFNKASIFGHEGRYGAMASQLMLSFMSCPFNNFCFKYVLRNSGNRIQWQRRKRPSEAR